MRPCTARAALALTLAAAMMGVPGRAEAYPDDVVALEGHGWGHGRGMGQWGALGYALESGWGWERILDHFYGGTSLGTIGNIPMSVRLTRFDDHSTLVLQEKGRLRTNAAGGFHKALMAQRIAANRFRVLSAPDCAGPWSVLNGGMTGPVTFQPGTYNDDRTEMLQVCEPSGARRWLRGDIQAVDSGVGSQRTVNHLGIELYLRGVVPRESPASWGNLGGGAGMNQLRAQAVAARSYSAAENRYDYAKTCDTTACQVYSGVAVQVGSSFTPLEDSRTNQAIAETAGKVRKHSNGAPARTEFSSSTGGHTAGGTFTAVRDDGDDICRSDACNPNHRWHVDVPVSRVESAWPQIGRLSSVQITERNGLGEWGGRARRVRIEGTNGTVTPTGDEVRSKLGLKSDWYRVIAPSGYWVVGDDGGVFTFGNANFYGSVPGVAPSSRTRKVGMAPTPSGKGYWIVGSDGGVFSFGDARFHGSVPGVAPQSATGKVGIAPTPSGKGYWIVGSDGGIFSFGDARFHGSVPGVAPQSATGKVGMAPTKSGGGYWIVGSDGGVFSFGDARFHGSVPGVAPSSSTRKVGMAVTHSGGGYWVVGEDGGIFTFGDAVYWGSVPGVAPSSTSGKVGMAASPVTGG